MLSFPPNGLNLGELKQLRKVKASVQGLKAIQE